MMLKVLEKSLIFENSRKLQRALENVYFVFAQEHFVSIQL